MKTSVTASSVQTYYSLDFSTVRGKVAEAIIRHTKAGNASWIRAIAQELGMDKSSVAGRMNELKKQPFRYGGKWYQLHFDGRKKDTYLGVTTSPETWKAVECAAPGEQTKLF